MANDERHGHHPNDGNDFEALLTFLQRTRGFLLEGYKRASLQRRITKRMQQVGIKSYAEYIDLLQVHPDEFSYLFNTILINVTSFFRDAPAWEYLTTTAIPTILAEKSHGEPIRVWSAGVATGQEAYSVAMLLAEALGDDEFLRRVKIYATDVDEEALNEARQATYSEREVEGIPPAFLEKYFERVGTRYVFRKDLRRAVIFGQHDLLQDPPISRIDLLLCRNTLMYFNAEAQTRVLGNLHYALNDNGFLFLGKSEMLITHTDLFAPADLKQRIFRKVVKGNHREVVPRLILPNHVDEPAASLAQQIRLREAAFDIGPVAQLAVDSSGLLSLANQQARAIFGLSSSDIGRPLQDLEVSYRPIELRSLIDQAYLEHRPMTVRDVERAISPEDIHHYDVQVTPLMANNGARLGVSITFVDVTRHKRLQDDLERSKHELEAAYEELQAANEELETTNEELQSTNEELETTNEELQSTNEELETMERGAPIHQRGAAGHQRRAAPAHRRPRRGERLPRIDPHQPPGGRGRPRS
jgi:two-component system CheB/CheR fusion protein